MCQNIFVNFISELLFSWKLLTLCYFFGTLKKTVFEIAFIFVLLGIYLGDVLYNLLWNITRLLIIV